MNTVFSPAWGSTTLVSNATSATAAVSIPINSDQLVLTNTSLTASVNVMLTTFQNQDVPPTGTAPTTSTGLKILPASQIRIYTGYGPKVIRTIASAADGVIELCPGRGV